MNVSIKHLEQGHYHGTWPPHFIYFIQGREGPSLLIENNGELMSSRGQMMVSFAHVSTSLGSCIGSFMRLWTVSSVSCTVNILDLSPLEGLFSPSAFHRAFCTVFFQDFNGGLEYHSVDSISILVTQDPYGPQILMLL